MLATYIIGSLALIVKPGPDLMCTIATALSEGRARALVFMSGLILGCWLWIVLLSAGVAAFFTGHRGVMLSVQFAGTCYIAYLAFCAWMDAAAEARRGKGASAAPATAKGWRLVARGVCMAMSNPLTILFFLAFLPGFTCQGSPLSPALQTFLLGTLFCALVPFVSVPAILAADFFRSRLLGSPKAMAALKFISAAMLSGVAAILAAGLVRGLLR